MLAMPATTPYDLRFRMLGIPVRVHPLFWLVSAMMGFNGDDPVGTLIWVACVFASILAHEYGHGLMGRAFGAHPQIALYWDGRALLVRSRAHPGAEPRRAHQRAGGRISPLWPLAAGRAAHPPLGHHVGEA